MATQRIEQKRIDIPGIGDVVATIKHHLRADGTAHLSELQGAMRYPRGAPLTESDLHKIAAILRVFY